MALPVTAGEIYDLLVADTTIAANLGTYVFAGGETRPSITVLSASEQLPPGTGISGVEIIISAIAGYNAKVLLTGETILNLSWRIYVMGWRSIEDLQLVISRIIALLPGATVRQNVFNRFTEEESSQDIGILDQVVIFWTNPCEAIVP